jgi:hypothetical protein
MKNNKQKSRVSEEVVFKNYHDNNLIHFETTLAKEDGRVFVLINGLPEHGEIKSLETLKNIIECLKAAKKKWKTAVQN